MPTNRDFSDLFKAFNAASVDYLVIGAHAVMHYTEPRFTKDLDVWVRPSPANASRVYRALAEFGAPLEGVSERDFTDPEMIYQIGVAPNRIDIMMGTAEVEFDDAWANRTESTYGDVPIHIIGKAELIRTKKATGRPRDLQDAEALEAGEET